MRTPGAAPPRVDGRAPLTPINDSPAADQADVADHDTALGDGGAASLDPPSGAEWVASLPVVASLHALARDRTLARAGTRAEEGSGSVLIVGAVAATLVLLLGLLAVVAAATAAHRVRTAADLAALAAAGAAAGVLSAHGSGAADPCLLAAQVAADNGAELRQCELQAGSEVLVEASLPVSLSWPGAPMVATAKSRAGPAAEDIAPP